MLLVPAAFAVLLVTAATIRGADPDGQTETQTQTRTQGQTQDPPAPPSPAPVARPAAAKQPDAEQKGLADGVKAVFERPVRPTFGSVAPGGGITGGVAWVPEPWKDGRLFASSRALVSIRKYWTLESAAGWQRDQKYVVEAFTRIRNMPQLRYYGLGAGALRDDQVNFRMLDRSVGMTGSYRLMPAVSVGGRVERLWPIVDPGTKSNLPSIETRFTDVTAPGLTVQPAMTHAQAFVTFAHRTDATETPRLGGDYVVSLSHFGDGGRGTTFRRVEFEMQERIAMPGVDRQLTLHAFYSDSQPIGDGNRVPFHMMRSLGGSNTLLGFRETLLGGETKASLRGFSTFRFRDHTQLLTQAEYGFKVRGPLAASVFVDAGMVAPNPAGLDLGSFKRNAGFSLSVIKDKKRLFRMDVGFGGGEGVHVFFSLGRGQTF